MKGKSSKVLAGVIGIASALGMAMSTAQAAPFMGAQWAKAICQDWNANDTLTTDLGGGKWAANSGKKGYKVIQMYRDGCGAGTRVELDIANQGGKAICTYAGAVKTKKLNDDVDYLMHASDKDWKCMGEGSWGCGAMGAMMTGKLKFEGPKMEAASVMDPFNAFLQLTGKVKGGKACPAPDKTASR